MSGLRYHCYPVRRSDLVNLAIGVLVIALVAIARPAQAHPVPFSYLDVQLQKSSIDVSLVAHIFDLAHDLQVTPADRLLDPAVVAERDASMRAMLAPRLELSADGHVLTPEWGDTEILRDRQSLRFHLHYPTASPAGTVAVNTVMFPYDPMHQTF